VEEDQPDALRALAELYRRTSNWERLAEVLARVAGTSEDRVAAVAALKEWASIVEVHLSGKWDPAPIYERVLDGEPYDPQAIMALDRGAYTTRSANALVALALRQVRAGGNKEWITSLCTRGGLVLLSQGKLTEAAEILRRGLQASPDYLPAVQLLRHLDQMTEEWGEAAELMLREGELATTPELARVALVRAGNILLDRFGDRDRARAAFEKVFNEDPSQAAAFGRLAGILAASEDWNSLVATYQRRMDVLGAKARIPLQIDLASLYRDRLRNTAAAIEVLHDVLKVDPGHRQALLEVSELCVMEQRWREAEQALEQLAAQAHDEPRVARDALLQRAQILEEQLSEEEQALEVLEELLDRFPGDSQGLARSLEVFRRRGNWEQTVAVLEQLVRSGPADQRVGNLVDLAELYSRTLGDAEGAHSSLVRAGRICVETGEGVERITEYFERRGDFEGLVAFLGERLEGLPPEGSAGSVTVRLARARILAGRLLRPNEAEAEILKALRSDRTSVSARLELAGLHLWGDNLAEATTEYLRVLDQDPFSPDAFRGLYRVFDRRGDLERAAGAAQAVCAVDPSKDAPERKVAAQASAPMEASLSSAMATPLGVHDFWNLLAHSEEPQLARELLFLVADQIPILLPQELELLDGGGGIVPLSSDDPVASRCGRLAQVLGVSRIECCLGRRQPTFVGALPGTPPRLVVEESFADKAPAAEFRFAVGRALCRVLTRSLYLWALKPRSVQLLLAGVTSLFERGFGEHELGHEVEDLAKVINRSLPRKVRKMLEEPARSYAAGQSVNVKAWQVAARRSSERAGLLLAGDVEGALAVLVKEQTSKAVQAELLRFAVGPHLYEARRRLGLSI
jgi:tetratricopeptide (TPR) repeat protein